MNARHDWTWTYNIDTDQIVLLRDRRPVATLVEGTVDGVSCDFRLDEELAGRMTRALNADEELKYQLARVKQLRPSLYVDREDETEAERQKHVLRDLGERR